MNGINWKTRFRYGKHKGKTLLQVWRTDRDFILGAFENEVKRSAPEIQFIINSIENAANKRMVACEEVA